MQILTLSGNAAMLIDAADGRLAHTLEGHAAAIAGSRFDSGKQVLTWAGDRTVRVWRLPTASEQASFPATKTSSSGRVSAPTVGRC